MMELQSRSNVDEMYPLCVPTSAVSILSLLYRITECTEPHKRESLDTAEVAMRCHFCSELYLVNF